jgi:hypothetical protein
MEIQMKVIVGQPVVIIHAGNYGHTYDFGYAVSKVTPTGRVTVKRDDKYERKFDSDGRELGRSSPYNRDWIETDVEKYKAIEARNRRWIKVGNAVNKVLEIHQLSGHHYWDEVNVVHKLMEIQIAVDAVKQMIEDIK